MDFVRVIGVTKKWVSFEIFLSKKEPSYLQVRPLSGIDQHSDKIHYQLKAQVRTLD